MIALLSTMQQIQEGIGRNCAVSATTNQWGGITVCAYLGDGTCLKRGFDVDEIRYHIDPDSLTAHFIEWANQEIDKQLSS